MAENIINTNVYEVPDEFTGSSYGEATAEELEHIIRAAGASGNTVCIVGAPGTGKTALLHSLAATVSEYDPDTRQFITTRKTNREKYDYSEVIEVIGSQLEPQDVSGLPHAATDEKTGVKYTEYLMPVWAKRLYDTEDNSPEDNKKILFFDEFSNTPRAVQSALLKIIGERRMPSGTPIPNNVLIIAAMNPEKSAVDYTPIAAPMANRMLFVSYRPKDSEFYEGMLGGWFSEEEKAAWSPNEKAWRNLIVDFLKKEPQLILAENDLANTQYDSSTETYLTPESENSESEREILVTAWASPRAWDNACRMLACFKLEHDLTQIQIRILNGMVGRKAAARLADFAHRRKQVAAYDIIMHPEHMTWRVSKNSSVTANDIQEAVSVIIQKMPTCDGLDGRPGAMDVVRFIDKAIDLGAGPYLAPYVCPPGATRTYLNNARPDDCKPAEWTKIICDLLVKFKENEYIS